MPRPTGQGVAHGVPRRLIAAMALLAALLYGSGFGSFARADSGSSLTVPASVQTRLGHNRVWQEGQWFQRSHIGNTSASAGIRSTAIEQSANLTTVGGAWSSLGPRGLGGGYVSGRVTALAVNPSNSNDVWLGAADGGVWHSTNGGGSWTPTTDKSSNLSIGSIAIDPHAGSPYTVYVGTGEANLNSDAYAGSGLLKGTFNSTTNKWVFTTLPTSQFKGLAIAKLAVIDPDPNNGNQATLLAAVDWNGDFGNAFLGNGKLSNVGIWRGTFSSSTSAFTWSHVLGGGQCAMGTDLAVNPATPSTVWAGVGNHLGYSSTTCAGAPDGIWVSTNSGQSWSGNNGIANDPQNGRISLGMSSNGNSILAVVMDSGANGNFNYGNLLGGAVYTTANGGATWSAHAVSSGMANGYNSSTWWYDNYAAVDPTNPNVMYAGGIDLWQSLDGGNTWNDLTAYCPPACIHVDQHALAFFGPSSASFYLGNDGGAFSAVGSPPTQNNFYTLNNTLSITQFYGGSIGTQGGDVQLYGGSQDNGEDQYPVTGTPSGARDWNVVYGGDGTDTVVDWSNNANVYANSFGMQINKSTDGGNSWYSATSGIDLCGCENINFVAPYMMSPNNSSELLAGTSRVYETTNGAGSWGAISPVLLDGSALAAIGQGTNSSSFPNADGYIYAGNSDAGIAVTTNGGGSWSTVTPASSTGQMVRGLAVDPTNPNDVYACFAGFAGAGKTGEHIFQSTNAGSSWTDISKSLPNIPCQSILVDAHSSTHDVIAGTDGGIYIATIPAPGTSFTWQKLGTGLPNSALDQLFTDRGLTTLYAATHGRSMWKIALP